MKYFKIFSVLLFITYVNSYGQFFESVQYVNVEKYQGKNFILESKIYDQNEITDESWVVLSARSVNDQSKQIKETLYNSNAEDYYKKEDWSNYELTGKLKKMPNI